MLNPETGQTIPALYLDFNKFRGGLNLDISKQSNNFKEESLNINSDVVEEFDSSIDEIENLFIRLNAGGTALRGEELNYSILKAHITFELQEKIESACKSLFKPARFITIAYRLFQQQKKIEHRDALSMRIKPKQFQKTVNENLRAFQIFLLKIINDKSYEGKTLLSYARYLLEFDNKNNSYGLPFILLNKISEVAPEVMLMYLHRLLNYGDRFNFNSEVHRKMIGIVTLFMWFGKGVKQRDHSKLIANIWPGAKDLDQNYFGRHQRFNVLCLEMD
ncbi:MAG: hypothetical protein IPN61_01150 [Bacteroidetes bacterium]|nr:hypothetical protein [Bacteroidota bacterium]